MTIEDLIKKAEELEQRASSIEAKHAELMQAEEEKRAAIKLAEERAENFYKENFKNMNTEEKRNLISQKFIETRAFEGLKLNETGTDYYGPLVEKFRIDKPLTSRAGFLKGSHTGFQIPLIKSRPAVNASSTEGDTGLAVDTQMEIGKKTITPELYYSILGISYQADKFSQVTDAEIEDAFAEAFGEAIETALQGRSTGAICGLLANDASVSTNHIEGEATWADMYKLTDNAKGKSGKWCIVVPAGIVSALIATSTDEYSFCKEELLRNGTIRGIEVVEVATPVDNASGAVYATLIDLSKNLKVAVAAEDIILRTVYDKNSLNKYLQGAMGIAAAVILPSEVYQLTAA